MGLLGLGALHCCVYYDSLGGRRPQLPGLLLLRALAGSYLFSFLLHDAFVLTLLSWGEELRLAFLMLLSEQLLPKCILFFSFFWVGKLGIVATLQKLGNHKYLPLCSCYAGIPPSVSCWTRGLVSLWEPTAVGAIFDCALR